MPSDKSQDHLKNLGSALKIMSVHTDLHSHKIQSFLKHCLQFAEIAYFFNYLETFYIMQLLISRYPVKLLQGQKYTIPLD